MSLVLAGCGGSARESWVDRIVPDARFRDREHGAVVEVGTHCSGVLIAPDLVLTAAHCIPAGENGAPTVYVLPEGHGAGMPFEADRCRMHPRAYPGFEGCAGRPHVDARTAFDLALLGLARPVPRAVAKPLPVVRARPSALARGAQVRLIGWHRRPALWGSRSRYGGLNTVLGMRAGVLFVRADGRRENEAFMTHLGNSGGPALVRNERGAAVVGVLSRHSFAVPRFSEYAVTFSPANAAFLEEASGP